jgi:hypothetical protein
MHTTHWSIRTFIQESFLFFFFCIFAMHMRLSYQILKANIYIYSFCLWRDTKCMPAQLQYVMAFHGVKFDGFALGVDSAVV